MSPLWFAAFLAVAVAIGGAIDLEKYRQDGYYGKGTKQPDNEEIRPFEISIPDSDLEDLKYRLAHTRFIDHLPGTEFNYGMNADELIKIVKYWNTTYDWRQEESKMNELPQFMTQIEGLDVHFVHVKASSEAKTVIPLLSVHGWPSSFYEIYEPMPWLTEPDEEGIAFEVIAPSIPGYGFSEGAHVTGLDYTAVARIFAKLMERLGHEKYLLQGGDWGSIITRAMAVMYKERVIGIHVLGLFDILENLLSPKKMARTIFTPHKPETSLEQIKRDYNKLFPLKETAKDAFLESGVMHYMLTKPDTLACPLNDSPAGLAAYILEKLATFVNPDNRDLVDGGLTKKFTMEQLLTTVSIYWFNYAGNVAPHIRLYKEQLEQSTGVINEKIHVPAGLVDTEHESTRTPRVLAEGHFSQMIQYTDLHDGGHLMFFEIPKPIVEDLRTFVHKVVKADESTLEKLKNKAEEKLSETKDKIDESRDNAKNKFKKMLPF